MDCVIEWKINGWMTFWLCMLKEYIVGSIDNETIIQQFNIWNFGEDNYITSCNCIFFSLQCRYF